eukprot:1769507-Rhodomonas_salina.1
MFDSEGSEEEQEEDAFPPSSKWTVDDWRLLYSSSKEAVKRGGKVGRARSEVVSQMLEGAQGRVFDAAV